MNKVILTPRVSEKAIGTAEAGTYVFDVPMAANKITIAQAVEEQFKVKVVGVNLLITKGKLKRFKKTLGRQKDVKKALVKLKSGDKIALFEAGK